VWSRPRRSRPKKIRSLSAEDVATVLEALRDTPIFPAVVVLLVTGMRRGELGGLQWGDVDLDAGRIEIERAVEQTKAHGLRLKAPKTAKGRRRVSIPPGAVEALRAHRKSHLEIRIALGLGKSPTRFPCSGIQWMGPFAILTRSRKSGSGWWRHVGCRLLPSMP
jgi:integrase